MVKAPSHLSKEAKVLWKKLCHEYSIEDAPALAILKKGLEAMDRADSARKAIDSDGLTIQDRNGQLKPHPLLPCERDSRAAFLHALKMLNFDLEPLNDRVGRPPRGNNAN